MKAFHDCKVVAYKAGLGRRPAEAICVVDGDVVFLSDFLGTINILSPTDIPS